MNDPNTPLLGNGDGQPRLSDRIHSGGYQRQIQRNVAGELSGKGNVLGKDFGVGGNEQDIVKSQCFSKKAHRVGSKRQIVALGFHRCREETKNHSHCSQPGYTGAV